MNRNSTPRPRLPLLAMIRVTFHPNRPGSTHKDSPTLWLSQTLGDDQRDHVVMSAGPLEHSAHVWIQHPEAARAYARQLRAAADRLTDWALATEQPQNFTLDEAAR